MTAFENANESGCDGASCCCREFAATSPEAANMIAATQTLFAENDEGREPHFRILPYAGGGPDSNMGRVEVFLLRRACGSTWSRFAESHVFHLADNVEPHIKRASMLAQFEVRPPASPLQLLEALSSGSAALA